jgi:hypothetical protein
MIVAWGFFLNIGSVIGRYYKKPPHDRTVAFVAHWIAPVEAHA